MSVLRSRPVQMVPHPTWSLFPFLSLSLYVFLLPPSFVTTDTFSCPLIKTESLDATLKSSSSSFCNQQQLSVKFPVALVSWNGRFSQAVYLTTFVCEVRAVHPVLFKQVYSVKQHSVFFTVNNWQLLLPDIHCKKSSVSGITGGILMLVYFAVHNCLDH